MENQVFVVMAYVMGNPKYHIIIGVYTIEKYAKTRADNEKYPCVVYKCSLYEFESKKLPTGTEIYRNKSFDCN